MMNKTVLIDGDILIYRIATVAEEAVEFTEDLVAAWVDMKEAKRTVRASVEDIKTNTHTDEAVICLTSPTTVSYTHLTLPTILRV